MTSDLFHFAVNSETTQIFNASYDPLKGGSAYENNRKSRENVNSPKVIRIHEEVATVAT
jgi:hypothetical protein